MNIKTLILLILSVFILTFTQGVESDLKLPINTHLKPEAVKIVQSPMVDKEAKHGQLFRHAYDAKHSLFPVKIISIDGWIVPEFVNTEASTVSEYNSDVNSDVNSDTNTQLNFETSTLKYLLAPGEHKMMAIPDFENIELQSVFMEFSWHKKYITFNIVEGQQIAVTARLLDVDTLEWDLQLYRVEIPIEAEREITIDKLYATPELNQ